MGEMGNNVPQVWPFLIALTAAPMLLSPFPAVLTGRAGARRQGGEDGMRARDRRRGRSAYLLARAALFCYSAITLRAGSSAGLLITSERVAQAVEQLTFNQ